MLAADKLLMQSNLKQKTIELREKELNLFNSNFGAVGTQAAIMAGFTLTSFVEIDLPPNKQWPKVRQRPGPPRVRTRAEPCGNGAPALPPLPAAHATRARCRRRCSTFS